jgi:hypothetical protein
MKFSRYLLPACVGVSMFCSFLNAQQPAASASSVIVPRLVNFSGKATDTQGRIFTGIAGATFAIYKDESEGAPLWMETQNVHADAKGNYTVQLGATKPDGLPLDLFTSGEARWLGVIVNGGQEQPRILLLSVPYALKAADSETLGGLPSSAFVRAKPENVHPGESSGASNSVPSLSPASANQAQPASLLTVKTSSPGANVGFIPMWTGSKSPTTRIGSSVLFQAGTNLGIGNTKPAANLDVLSATNPGGPIAKLGSKGTSDSSSVLIYSGSGTAETFVAGCIGCFVPGAQPGDGGLRVSPGNRILLGDSSANRVLIDNVGNVEQKRTAGGMVKAMLHFSPFSGGRIISCFNSTLSGTAATTAPCGLTFDITGTGDYIFDFGFEVDDRIYSAVAATQTGAGAEAVVTACGNQDGQCLHTGVLTNNQVEVGVIENGFADAKLHLIVY